VGSDYFVVPENNESQALSSTEENALRARIKELQDYRRNGITSNGDAEKFVRDGATRVSPAPLLSYGYSELYVWPFSSVVSYTLGRMVHTQIIFDPVEADLHSHRQLWAMIRYNRSMGPFLYLMGVTTTNITAQKKASPGFRTLVVLVSVTSKLMSAILDSEGVSHSRPAQPCQC
jgi:hypothetical protein